MRYFITFLEGVLSFLSPCMLPLLPVYVSYFAGASARRARTFINALCFVLGFSTVFCLLGMFAGTLGALLAAHRTAVNLITGLLVIFFGLSCLELFRLPFFRGMTEAREVTGAFSAFLFGTVYAVSLTPCVGAFLGSALMLAASSSTLWRGASLLLVYSLGLGLPFILAAVLIDQLGSVLQAVKRHYGAIMKLCGCFLILVGILMMTGQLDRLMAVFS